MAGAILTKQRAALDPFAVHLLVAAEQAQRPCCRDTQAVHRLGTQVLRMVERNTARPSPSREKGVSPPPLSCSLPMCAGVGDHLAGAPAPGHHRVAGRSD